MREAGLKRLAEDELMFAEDIKREGEKPSTEQMSSGERLPYYRGVAGRRGGQGIRNMRGRQGPDVIEDGNIIHFVEAMEDAGEYSAAEQASREINYLRRDFSNFVKRQDMVNRNLDVLPEMLERHKKGLDSLEVVASNVNKQGNALEYLLKTVARHDEILPGLQREVEQVGKRLENIELKLDGLNGRTPSDRAAPSKRKSSKKRPQEARGKKIASSGESDRVVCEHCKKKMLPRSLWAHKKRLTCPVLKAKLKKRGARASKGTVASSRSISKRRNRVRL